MKIVISWSGSRVLANAEKAIWCGKPDYEIGVALFYELTSAKNGLELILAWKRESQNIVTRIAASTRATPTNPAGRRYHEVSADPPCGP